MFTCQSRSLTHCDFVMLMCFERRKMELLSLKTRN